ncbi:MAG: Fic family protein [Microcoleus sp.]|uniref:Fic family protein n=1 Tax=Microcoleus sp. TaxID=44472 RepID=UPI003C71D52C
MEPENPQEVAEVVNYIGAINYGLERLKSLPVSLRLIREIHKQLMQGVRGAERDPGEFRHTQNWIGAGGCSLADATYVPPPPHEMLQSLDNLEKFLHSPQPIPTLIKVGLAHAQFETIHPFLDGNGRTGRLLITFLLCEQNILQRPLLYISHYFKKYRSEYYDRLQAVRDSGNWESWLKFFLRGVYEVAQEAAATARKIVNLKEEHRQLVLNAMGRRSGNAIALLESLYFRPIFTVEHVEEITRLSYPNANSLIKALSDIGILEEITGQKRNRAFSYATYLAVFRDS